ncbi:hypothetical protein [Sulfitobacter sp. R18_1]|uniref:hypothetical protein n=1 Tax=Sulfitobacter sp. R18_1 TaxID=2821104 RepID=UPI001ADAD5EE|nr:hypothetical protein [Sulfitobacter sp. R18_1]MBO9428097.1 hypothetical protein [Sulfitobacter sp. R18_1]
MALSLKDLERIFPADEPAFTPPFHVHADENGEVHIYDAEDALFTSFCRVTQMPIGDDRALRAEEAYWEKEAGRIVIALNAAYPKPA